MTQQASGDIARQMAATPLKPRNGAKPVTVAPQPIAETAIAETLERIEQDAATAASGEENSNPILAKIGWPSFRLVSNARWYDDENDASKASMKYASAEFNLGGLTLTWTIYRERQIVQRADGRYAQFGMRFSLPKALSVDKNDSTTVLALEAFKGDVMDRFQTWKAGLDPVALAAASKAQSRGLVNDGFERMPDAPQPVAAPVAPAA